MIQLIKGEFTRILSKKYIFIMILLLVLLNLYIVNYDYDSFMNYNDLKENVKDAVKLVEGDISREKTKLVKEALDNATIELENVTSEEEGSKLATKRFYYNNYLDYIQDNPFPLHYKDDKVFENKRELVNQLKEYESSDRTNSLDNKELSTYLSLTENIKKDSFYIMYWDKVFQQNSSFFLMIIVIIAMATVFGEDYSSNVAPLSLSSKYGKTELVKARIIVSLIYGWIIAAIFFISELILKLYLHGINGYQGRVSLLNFIYTPNMTPVGQIIIFFMFSLLATLSLSLFTLGVSLIVKRTLNTILAMTLIILVSETLGAYFINNISVRIAISNFYSSFIEYNPINIFGVLIHYPIYLILVLIIITFLSLIGVIYKGKKQEI